MSNISDFEINKGNLKKYVGQDEAVVIPDCVSTISDKAFWLCREITSITIPDGVWKIGKHAFFHCDGLTEVTLPVTVREIGNNAFANCENLEKITILSKYVDFEQYALAYCSQSKIIAPELPLYLYPDKDSKLMAVNGFLSDVSLYKNADIYNDYCQYLTSQRKRLLPEFFKADNVSAIAFYCDNKKVTAKNFNEEYLEPAQRNNSTDCVAFLLDWKNKNISAKDVQNNADRELKKDPFNVADMKKLWSYKQQEDGTLMLTKYKGDEKHITVPERIGKKPVTRLDCYLFATRHYMGERIPADREKVMSAIESVTIPDSVTLIGEYAFRGCEGLKDENGFVIVRGVLYDYFGNSSDITIPDTVEVIEGCVFETNFYIKSLTINDKTKEIELGAFRSCSDLEKLTLCSGLNRIGPQAFSFCEKLTSVIIPEGVTELGDSAFYGCTNLSEIIIPASVVTIGKFTFSGCEKLVIHTPAGSYAEQYAKEHNIKFCTV